MHSDWHRSVMATAAAALTYALLGSAAAGAPPATLPTPPTPAPDGWVTLPAKGQQPLANAHREVIRGQRDERGNCLVKVQLSLPPQANAVAANEVARNTTTCEEALDVGTPLGIGPAPTGNPSDMHSQSGRAQAHPTPGSHAPRTRRRLSGYGYPTESAGYMHTWWTDPIGIVVNQVYNDVDWWWDGDCVDGFSWLGYRYYWFWPTSWILGPNYWYYGQNCNAAWSGSDVEFINLAFCAPIEPFFPSTFTEYQPNEVDGWWDGYLTGYIYSYSWGSVCSYLLSGHYELIRTYY